MVNLITRKASVRWTGANKSHFTPVPPLRGRQNANKTSAKTLRNASADINSAELMATAHANSFSFALSNELHGAGAAGNTITTSHVTLEHATAGWAIKKVHLDVVATLPHFTQGSFIDASMRAKTRCLISNLLRTSISMNAKLSDGLA